MATGLSDLAHRLRRAAASAKAYRKAHPLKRCLCGAELENNNQSRCIRCRLEREAQIEEQRQAAKAPKPKPARVLPACACGQTVTSNHSTRCTECQRVWRSSGYQKQRRAGAK